MIAILDKIPKDNHAVIEASAGTGKTYTIEHLFVSILLNTPNILIENILVLTFTEKAKIELKKRIHKNIEESRNIASLNKETLNNKDKLEKFLLSFDKAQIYTIHGFFQRILIENTFNSQRLFNQKLVDGKAIFSSVFKKAIRKEFAKNLEKEKLREFIKDSKNGIKELEDFLFKCLSKQISFSNMKFGDDKNLNLAINSFFNRLDKLIKQEKYQKGFYDYNDMIFYVWEALNSKHKESFLKTLRNKYFYAIVDESQDTDEIQWKIFKEIFINSQKQNIIYLVGDPKQAIYAFRHADVYTYLAAKEVICDNLDNFSNLIDLDCNYRSSDLLVEAFNKIFEQNSQNSFFTGDIKYIPVKCGITNNNNRNCFNDKPPVVIFEVFSDNKINKDNYLNILGKAIAKEIKSLLENKKELKANDIFILTYKNQDGLNIANFLREEKILFSFFKQEGLFSETQEAQDVKYLFLGIYDPFDKTKRFKAYNTAFFSFQDNQDINNKSIQDESYFLELLFDWHKLAKEKNYYKLFSSIISKSGIIKRELYFSKNERKITNYLHIFEILLEEAILQNLDFLELMLTLNNYIDGNKDKITQKLDSSDDIDNGGNSKNIQRLETEKDAVQIMTIHKSKGLQAKIVFIYGIFFDQSARDLSTFHNENKEKMLYIGKIKKDELTKLKKNKTLDKKVEIYEKIKKEAEEEHQRLTYVAITRAADRLYLPYISKDSKKSNFGINTCLNSRLESIVNTLKNTKELDHLFCVEKIINLDIKQNTQDTENIRYFNNANNQIADNIDNLENIDFKKLIKKHKGSQIISYTSLTGNLATSNLYNQEYQDNIKTTFIKDYLKPVGTKFGIIVHEIIKKISFESVQKFSCFKDFSQDAEISKIFEESFMLHEFIIDKTNFNNDFNNIDYKYYIDYTKQIVYNSLTSQIALKDGILNGFCSLHKYEKEFEFIYAKDKNYVKGYIDLVFEHNKRFYIVDWKTNLLENYEQASMQKNFDLNNYLIQAKIYSIAVTKMLQIKSQEDYENKFGGVIYYFIRVNENKTSQMVQTQQIKQVYNAEGLYFKRLSYDEIFEEI